MLPEYKGLLPDQEMWFLNVLLVILIMLIVAGGVEKLASDDEALFITSSLVFLFWAKICCLLINFTDFIKYIKEENWTQRNIYYII